MGVFYEALLASLAPWILAQKMFWVATAPLSGDGHVNVSPKGGPNFFGLIEENTRFWYMEMSGSGNETMSHLYEPGNGRITIQFNAFEGPPRILRLWGKGSVYERGTQEYENFISEHKVDVLAGTRSIITVSIHQVGTSCGFSVPFYDFKEWRTTLKDYYEKKEQKYNGGKEEEKLDRYWAYKNAWSIDGLPGMKTAQTVAQKHNIAPIKKFVGQHAPGPTSYKSKDAFTLEQVVSLFVIAFVLGVIAALLAPTFMVKQQSGLMQQLRSMASMSA